MKPCLKNKQANKNKPRINISKESIGQTLTGAKWTISFFRLGYLVLSENTVEVCLEIGIYAHFIVFFFMRFNSECVDTQQNPLLTYIQEVAGFCEIHKIQQVQVVTVCWLLKSVVRPGVMAHLGGWGRRIMWVAGQPELHRACLKQTKKKSVIIVLVRSTKF